MGSPRRPNACKCPGCSMHDMQSWSVFTLEDCYLATGMRMLAGIRKPHRHHALKDGTVPCCSLWATHQPAL